MYSAVNPNLQQIDGAILHKYRGFNPQELGTPKRASLKIKPRIEILEMLYDSMFLFRDVTMDGNFLGGSKFKEASSPCTKDPFSQSEWKHASWLIVRDFTRFSHLLQL